MIGVSVDSGKGVNVEDGVITVVEEVVGVLVTLPWGAVKVVEPFCAPAIWNIKAAGMIKNLIFILICI